MEGGATTRIHIHGHTLTVKGGHVDDGYARTLAAHVSAHMEKLTREAPLTPLAQVAMLAAMNIAHELFQLRDQSAAREADLDSRTRDLLESIDAEFHSVRHDA